MFALANTILNNFPWPVVLILLRYINIYVYKVIDREIVLRLQKRVKNSCYVTDEYKSFSYACGRWYLLYLINDDMTYAWVITTQNTFTDLIAPTNLQYLPCFKDAPGATNMSGHVTGQYSSLCVYRRFGNYSLRLPQVPTEPYRI